MKKVFVVILILICIITFSAIRIYKTASLCDKISKLAHIIEDEFAKDEWVSVQNKISEICELWEENRLWACLTLSTKQIDEIEISLQQCLEYSKLGAKADFIGEFKMFCMLIEHLPRQEGISLEELL